MKLGKIRISAVLLRESPYRILPLFQSFVPVHIESRPHMSDYIYTGYSEDFDDIAEGFEIPFYGVKLSKAVVYEKER